MLRISQVYGNGLSTIYSKAQPCFGKVLSIISCTHKRYCFLRYQYFSLHVTRAVGRQLII